MPSGSYVPFIGHVNKLVERRLVDRLAGVSQYGCTVRLAAEVSLLQGSQISTSLLSNSVFSVSGCQDRARVT